MVSTLGCGLVPNLVFTICAKRFLNFTPINLSQKVFWTQVKRYFRVWLSRVSTQVSIKYLFISVVWYQTWFYPNTVRYYLYLSHRQRPSPNFIRCKPIHLPIPLHLAISKHNFAVDKSFYNLNQIWSYDSLSCVITS